VRDPIRLGIVGLGKIASDQHVPAIAQTPAFDLVATASPDNEMPGVTAYSALGDMVAAGGIDAVAICTPPAVRHQLACEAIAAGLHVFLEKPPAATLCEARDLIDRAAGRGTTLFAAWHSREAAGVAAAKAWLAGRAIEAVRIEWKEDIRRWHPGQEWILGPGGFGVFDPGINALSILTRIVPETIIVKRSSLTFPEGRAAPIAATIEMRLAGGGSVQADFDFLQTGPQTWTITVTAGGGSLVLADGGARLNVEGRDVPGENTEYPRLYACFAELIASGTSDVDLRPLELVADAYLMADRRAGPPFEF
jgi:predicted dehydrogenase